jgi:hypothetical protein
MMHDKLIDLAKLAGYGIQHHLVDEKWIKYVWGGKSETDKLGRFADAIVEQCIEAIQLEMTRGLRDEHYRGQIDAVKAIKERFGVE